jgi:hypothetical protein
MFVRTCLLSLLLISLFGCPKPPDDPLPSTDGNSDGGTSDGNTDGSSPADGGTSDGSGDGTTDSTDPVDAGSGTGSSDGTTDGSEVNDSGSSDGTIDGIEILDSGSGNGSSDGSSSVDAGPNIPFEPNFVIATIAESLGDIWDVSIVDIDSDADFDFLVSFFDANEVGWFENDTSGQWTKHIISSAAIRTFYGNVHGFDLDHDNDIDVISPKGWHENDGNQNFTTHTPFDEGFVSWGRIWAGDFDGDQHVDMMTSSGGEGDPMSITWYQNDGAAEPTFVAQELLANTYGDSPYFIVGELSGDAYLDIAFVKTGAGFADCYWLENDQNTSPFTSHLVTESADSWSDRGVHIGDLTGDNSADIIVSHTSWLKNDGPSSSSFAPMNPVSDCGDCRMIQNTIVDLDNDGALDIVAVELDLIANPLNGLGAEDQTYAVTKKLSWYQNDGAATPSFTRHLLAILEPEQSSIHTDAIGSLASEKLSLHPIDWDKDGDLDFVIASRDDESIIWAENK